MARVLVVDDEQDVAQLIKLLLEKHGHAVSTASNGEEALARLGVEPRDPAAPLPDLVIMDVIMPVMDGFTACQRLAADPRTRALPVLVLTGKGGTREAFSEIPNVAAQIDKPFHPSALLELLRSMLPDAPAQPA